MDPQDDIETPLLHKVSTLLHKTLSLDPSKGKHETTADVPNSDWDAFNDDQKRKMHVFLYMCNMILMGLCGYMIAFAVITFKEGESIKCRTDIMEIMEMSLREGKTEFMDHTSDYDFSDCRPLYDPFILFGY